MLVETPYYHICGVNRNGQTFNPRIPRFAKTAGSIENSTIKRICCSPSIEGCLKSSGCSKTVNKSIFYVHKLLIENNAEIIMNNQIVRNKYVYDAKITEETWICSPAILKFIGVIKITKLLSLQWYKTKLINGKEYKFDIRDCEYEWIDLSNIKQKYSKFYKNELPQTAQIGSLICQNS